MGMKGAEFVCQGSMTRIVSRNTSRKTSKEGDSTLLNSLTRPSEHAWPNVAIESGDSKSLAHQRMNARWWIGNSRGHVRIVICIKIDKKNRKIQILKYVPTSPPSLYNMRNQRPVGVDLVADISLDHSVSPPNIQGAPSVLEFTEVFGRQPIPPNENDIVLNIQDLDEWAATI
jgi:hypothetical protein